MAGFGTTNRKASPPPPSQPSLVFGKRSSGEGVAAAGAGEPLHSSTRAADSGRQVGSRLFSAALGTTRPLNAGSEWSSRRSSETRVIDDDREPPLRSSERGDMDRPSRPSSARPGMVSPAVGFEDAKREMEARKLRQARFGTSIVSDAGPAKTPGGGAAFTSADTTTTVDAGGGGGGPARRPFPGGSSSGVDGGEDRAGMDEGPAIQGTCMDMCPESERERREREFALDKYERVDGDRSRTTPDLAVKKYTREADHQRPDLVRPLPVLQRTMEHLLGLLSCPYDDAERDMLSLHSFLWDRMRSVRQDLRMQHIFDEHTVAMTENMIRFHILAMHENCEFTKETGFDVHLNIEQMNKAMSDLFEIYADARWRGQPYDSEAEFRGYYALLKLDNHPGFKVSPSELVVELKKLPTPILHSEDMKFARNVARAWRTQNYSAFFRLARRASYLQACLMHAHFPKMRSVALQGIHESLRRGGTDGVPAEEVQQWLALTPAELAEVLQYHGLSLRDGQLMRTDNIFDNRGEQHPPRVSDLVQAKRASTIKMDVLSGYGDSASTAAPQIRAASSPWGRLVGAPGTTRKPPSSPSFAPPRLRSPAAAAAAATSPKQHATLQKRGRLFEPEPEEDALEDSLAEEALQRGRKRSTPSPRRVPLMTPDSPTFGVSLSLPLAILPLSPTEALDLTGDSALGEEEARADEAAAESARRAESLRRAESSRRRAAREAEEAKEAAEREERERQVEEARRIDRLAEEERARRAAEERAERERVAELKRRKEEALRGLVRLLWSRWRRRARESVTKRERRRRALLACAVNASVRGPGSSARAALGMLGWTPQEEEEEENAEGGGGPALRKALAVSAGVREHRIATAVTPLDVPRIVAQGLQKRSSDVSPVLCLKLLVCSGRLEGVGAASSASGDLPRWIRTKLFGRGHGSGDAGDPPLVFGDVQFVRVSRDTGSGCHRTREGQLPVVGKEEGSFVCYVSREIGGRMKAEEGASAGKGSGGAVFVLMPGQPLAAEAKRLRDSLVRFLPPGGGVPLAVVAEGDESTEARVVRELGLDGAGWPEGRVGECRVVFVGGRRRSGQGTEEEEEKERKKSYFKERSLVEGLEWIAERTQAQPRLRALGLQDLISEHLRPLEHAIERLSPEISPSPLISSFNSAVDQAHREIHEAFQATAPTWPPPEIAPPPPSRQPSPTQAERWARPLDNSEVLSPPKMGNARDYLPDAGWKDPERVRELEKVVGQVRLPPFPEDAVNGAVTSGGEESARALLRALAAYVADAMGGGARPDGFAARSEAWRILSQCSRVVWVNGKRSLVPSWPQILWRVIHIRLSSLLQGPPLVVHVIRSQPVTSPAPSILSPLGLSPADLESAPSMSSWPDLAGRQPLPLDGLFVAGRECLGSGGRGPPIPESPEQAHGGGYGGYGRTSSLQANLRDTRDGDAGSDERDKEAMLRRAEGTVPVPSLEARLAQIGRQVWVPGAETVEGTWATVGVRTVLGSIPENDSAVDATGLKRKAGGELHWRRDQDRQLRFFEKVAREGMGEDKGAVLLSPRGIASKLLAQLEEQRRQAEALSEEAESLAGRSGLRVRAEEDVQGRAEPATASVVQGDDVASGRVGNVEALGAEGGPSRGSMAEDARGLCAESQGGDDVSEVGSAAPEAGGGELGKKPHKGGLHGCKGSWKTPRRG